MTHAYGLIGPDPVDTRDLQLKLTPLTALPTTPIDLTALLPTVQDQGQLGSCSSFALDGAIEYVDHASGKAFAAQSHLQLYYNARTRANKGVDSGAVLRDAIKALSIYGAAPETLWPYDISKFTVSPPTAALKAGFQHTAVKYARVPVTPLSVVTALQAGYPVIAGILVYSSFESAQVAQDGLVPIPDVANEQKLGGHAVLIEGYVQTPQGWHFKVRNSWGEGWGDKGYFYLPIEYINSNLCWDFWTLSAVSGSPRAKVMMDEVMVQTGLSEDQIFEFIPALYEILKDFLTGDGSLSPESRIPIQEGIARFLEEVGLQ